MCLVGTALIIDVLLLIKSHAFWSLKQSRGIINCETLTRTHLHDCVFLVGNALLTFFSASLTRARASTDLHRTFMNFGTE